MPVKERRQSEQRLGAARDPQLRAAPGSADRLAATGSQLLKERDADEELGVRDVRDGDAVAAGELERAQRRLDAMATVCADSIITPSPSSRWSSTNVEIRDCQLCHLIADQLGVGGGWVASATTECHLGADGSRSREVCVHHKIRTP